MTQEDKDLLLKDLCARLPYGVKVDIPDLFISTKNNIEVLNEIFCGDDGLYRVNDSGMLIEYIKPYLFPLSSMTEEQKKEMKSFDPFKTDEVKTLGDWAVRLVEFYNKHHLDYHGLIPKGLANDATGLNIY